jgi:hypothetical protein
VTAVTAARTSLARVIAVDSTGLQPFVALRAAAGVAVPLAVGTALGHPAEGAIAAAGALPAGVAGIGGGFRARTGLIAATTAGMTTSTFVGGLVAGHLPAILVVLAAWGFGAGLVVVLGRDATIVGTQALVGLVVFGRFPGSVASSAAHAGWVLAGGGLQGALTAAFRSPQRFAGERKALAHAYAELARLGHDVTQPAGPAAEAVLTVTELVGRLRGSEDVDVLRGLADEAGRLRLELQSLGRFAALAGVQELAAAAATRLRRVSQALRDGHGVEETEDPAVAEAVARLRTGRDAAPPGPAGTPVRYAAARAAALLGQLRAVERQVGALAGIRRFALPHGVGTPAFLLLPNRAVRNARRLLRVARDPRTPAFRHAVRLAVVLPLGEGLSHVLPGQRGYWVALTIAVVLKPDYAATFQRGVGRVLGTALGVALTGLLAVAIHPSGVAVTTLVACFAWASYTVFAASYALYSFAITALVVLLIAPTGSNALVTVGDRGLDTVVGGALALIAYAVWPTWEGGTLRASVGSLFDALADYADEVLRGYVDPAAIDRGRLSRAATTARRARVDAQASLDRAAVEPARAESDTTTAAGLLAAARRIVAALHGLRTTLEDAEQHAPLPEVEPARVAVVAALRGLAARDLDVTAGLREHQQEIVTRAADDPTSLHARRLAVVAAHLDPLVDSVDTSAHVLSSADPVSRRTPVDA